MSEEKLDINRFNWYPGHIAKAEKQLKEKINVVDIIIELRDARIPYASEHLDLSKWAQAKPIITVLNKVDLADPKKLNEFLSKTDRTILKTNSKTGQFKELMQAINKAAEPIRDKFKKKGVLNRASRLMIVGYPNIGKSSLINKLTKTHKAKVQNKPGVTRQQQWVDLKVSQKKGSLSSKEITLIKLLDTPGIIPTKLYSDEQALKLAMCNCLGEKAYDLITVAREAINMIHSLYPGALNKYYGLDDEAVPDLESIAKQRSWIIKSKETEPKLDLERTAHKFMHDFQDGNIGNLSLE